MPVAHMHTRFLHNFVFNLCTSNGLFISDKVKFQTKPNFTYNCVGKTITRVTMPKTKTIQTDYEHGQLINSIVVKAFFVRNNQAFVIDEKGNSIQTVDIQNLESNKSFELKKVIIEKRSSFAFNYAILSTAKTQVIQLKRNIKKQFKKKFQKFNDAKSGTITNLKCVITGRDGDELRLFDGEFFKMKLKNPIEFQSDKLELLFVKKSFGYNYVWETHLTTIIEGADKDPDWDELSIPEVELQKNPNEIPMNHVGKWCAMLTTVVAPYTYSNSLFVNDFLESAPNSPKKVKRFGDGMFKVEKTNEVFKEAECRQEIRLDFRASDGTHTIRCVCFTKVASSILRMNSLKFISMQENDQRKKIKEILYENKLLTLKKQEQDFLLIDVEHLVPHQEDN